jgi:spore coat polysaccharide biosynthesis protein SpsF
VAAPKKKIVAIIQARTGSTRLPRKVLEEIGGKPMLWHVIERVKRARLVDEVVVATTDGEEDSAVEKIAEECGVGCFRGSEEDVLDRYYRAAEKFGADIVVRITADCPLIDPEIIDRAIRMFLDGNFDYVSNTLPPTFPDGLDVEVFSLVTLRRAWEEARKASEREHVTPYIRNHPEIFRLGNLKSEVDLSHMRWTVDRPEDLMFVREIYRELYREGEVFHMRDVLRLLERRPELMEINKHIERDEGYKKSLREDRIVKA